MTNILGYQRCRLSGRGSWSPSAGVLRALGGLEMPVAFAIAQGVLYAVK